MKVSRGIRLVLPLSTADFANILKLFYLGLHLPNNGTTVILKFEAPLHFANVANFREEVNKQLAALSSSPEGIATGRNGNVSL